MPGALRGNVHWYDYGPVIGAELSDNRPALVLSNDQLNRQLELCITVPMSTAMPDVRFLMNHVRIEEADSWASTRQIKSVHQGLLGELIAKASPDEMNSVILSITQRLARRHAPGQMVTTQGMFQISAGTIWDLHLRDTQGQDFASPVLVIDYNAGSNMAVAADIEYAERGPGSPVAVPIIIRDSQQAASALLHRVRSIDTSQRRLTSLGETHPEHTQAVVNRLISLIDAPAHIGAGRHP